jgi:hypothetical protein
MSAGQVIGIIIVVALLFSFLVPVFSMTSESGSLFGANYETTANVSLTFYALRCGSYMNAHDTGTFGGITITHPTSNGYNFQCNFAVSSNH